MHGSRFGIASAVLVIGGYAALCGGCTAETDEKLAALRLPAEAQSALSRARFSRLHRGDRLERNDIILCGPGDRLRLGFSRRLVVEYLGRDADWLLPELFGTVPGEDLVLEVPERQLVRLRLPRGIGTDVPQPPAFVRAVDGTPLWSGDMRTIAQLFTADGVEELYARIPPAKPAAAAPQKAAPAAPASNAKPVPPGEPWRLGVAVLPRMGPRSAGVVISDVLTDGPAARAGLARGDRILAVEGRQVASLRELKAALAESRGRSLHLTVRLKGESKPTPMTLDR